MSRVPRRLGKYELQGLLGRGGMAEVWKAFDAQLERYVAIKILRADLQNDPDFMKRFVREAQVVASLHHPNIVQVHDFQIAPPELDNTSAYMVMDYIEGQTLTEFIRNTSRAGKFPPAAEIIHLFTCICSAVDYAHQRGMIHRDIKPANILLDKIRPSRYEIGTPFLADFGIVKLVGTSTVTVSGWWLGTPLYISPEQALGQPGNERSDIYSLGIILYEICTGVRPFQGDNIASIIMQHINTTPTAPALINPKITPVLTEVIMHALDKDPAGRFPSASSMANALAGAFNTLSSTPVKSQVPSVNISNMQVYLSPISPATTSSTPQLAASEVLPHNIVIDGPGDPVTPLNSTSGHSLDASENQNLSSMLLPQLLPELTSPSPSPPHRRRRSVLIALITLLILIVASSSASVFYFTSRQSSSTPTPVPPIQLAGHAAFVNSGSFNNDNSQGVEDELQIDLQHIPNPAPGKSYYAWLLSDDNQNPMTSILLEKLSVIQGSVHFLYLGDAQHSNLIATYSRFLITEENSNSTPTPPSSDHHIWRYYAELPQTANTTNAFNNSSILDHLRSLLSGIAPPANDTTGGVAIWLLRNTKRVLDETKDAMNSQNPTAIRSHLVNTLAYIDGVIFLPHDWSAGPPVSVDPALYKMALVNFTPAPLPSYLGQTDNNLLPIVMVRGLTPDRSKLADQTDTALETNVLNWLQQVYNYAKQLLLMNPAQLLSKVAQSTLSNLVTQASYAYNGQTVSKVQQEGVQRIYRDIQSLATFDVQPYSSN